MLRQPLGCIFGATILEKFIGRCLLIGSVLILGAVSTPASSLADTEGPSVSTEEGPVQGFVKNGVNEFLGIPYAAPPVGDLRWMPPQPHDPWTTPLQATTYGNTCPQNQESGVYAGPPSTTEDCLYLNVFAPRLGSETKPPVLVWIHGGSNIGGESNDWDGSELATQGPTVVVTINYRLGLLGILAHPALDSEGHPFANYAIMDQQAALKWVQKNIAAFGGDPNNVTLGGQSAGATNTGANVLSPKSAGLFHRAIIMSGWTNNGVAVPLELAETHGTDFAVAAGCGSGAGATTVACLRALSVSQILSLQGSPTAPSPNPYVITRFIVDGTIIPDLPDEAWATGHFNHMPVMSGFTRDESAFVLMINEYLGLGPLTEPQYVNLITSLFSGPTEPGAPNYPPGTASAVLQECPVSVYASPSLAYTALNTDLAACSARLLDRLVAPQVPVYAYRFDDRTAPSFFPPVSFPTGAYHSSDNQYVFPLFHGGNKGTPHPLDSEQERLSDLMVFFWTTFARTGNPNPNGSNHPWPYYNNEKPVYLSENAPNSYIFSDAEFIDTHHCSFWDSISDNGNPGVD
jgi:para-nitrobenzyl esterase